MALYDDDASQLLDSPTGIVGVSAGGTGSNLAATGGTGQVLKQASTGAAVTVGTISTADLSNYASGSVAYSAGNFTASAGTWTVDSGDVALLAYTRIGDLLFYQFTINSTDVSVTPNYLQIALPTGYTAVGDSRGTFGFGNAGVAGTGMYAASGTSLRLYTSHIGTGTWTATSSDNTEVKGVGIIRLA